MRLAEISPELACKALGEIIDHERLKNPSLDVTRVRQMAVENLDTYIGIAHDTYQHPMNLAEYRSANDDGKELFALSYANIIAFSGASGSTSLQIVRKHILQ